MRDWISDYNASLKRVGKLLDQKRTELKRTRRGCDRYDISQQIVQLEEMQEDLQWTIGQMRDRAKGVKCG